MEGESSKQVKGIGHQQNVMRKKQSIGRGVCIFRDTWGNQNQVCVCLIFKRWIRNFNQVYLLWRKQVGRHEPHSGVMSVFLKLIRAFLYLNPFPAVLSTIRQEQARWPRVGCWNPSGVRRTCREATRAIAQHAAPSTMRKVTRWPAKGT